MLKFAWVALASLTPIACWAENQTPEVPAPSPGSSGAPSTASSGGSSANPTSTGLDPNAGMELTRSTCAGLKLTPATLPPLLELVVDTSASMSLTAPTTLGRSKWAITREALREAIAELPDSAGVGVLYYPNMPTNPSESAREVSACVNVDTQIPVALLGKAGSSHRLRINESLERAKPNGATPTHDAYSYALVNGLGQVDLPGQRCMLVITDGAPTLAQGCLGLGVPQSPQPTQPILDAIWAARSDRAIRTFLIGSPGSEDNGAGGDMRPWLSTGAVLGGTAIPGCNVQGPNYCHVDLVDESDFASALRARLSQIVGQLVSCSFELPAEPDGAALDPTRMNLLFTPSTSEQPQLVMQNPESNCYFGWLRHENTLKLCGQTCEIVRRDPGAKLELLLGCATQQVPAR
jgi:hypothetical protein